MFKGEKVLGNIRCQTSEGCLCVLILGSTKLLQVLNSTNTPNTGQNMQAFLRVPQDHDEEITFLYSLIKQNPNLFRDIDKEHFVDTPLHLAAGEGRTQLALEIQRLMPSFGRKLNPDGFSPVDLALRRGHVDTVSALIKVDPQLPRVKGREGITPLHYAAERDDVYILAEFLLSCPDSIEELTIRGESAVHVAVKNGNSAAFKVLLGWLTRNSRRDVLKWRDWKGNTVLHLAASTNQTMVMELLVKEVFVNDKNSKGLTALDVVMELPTQVNGRALQILRRRGAKSGSSIPHPKIATFADYLSSPLTIIERTIRLGAYLKLGLPGEVRNAVQVVAVLIATAALQAMLSPPSGASHQTTTNTSPDGTTGKVLMRSNDFNPFVSVNSVALAASMGMIFLVLPTRRYNLSLHLSLLLLMLSYMVATQVTSPSETQANGSAWASYAVFFLIISVKVLVLNRRNVRASRRLMGSNNFFNINEVITLLFQGKYVGNYTDGHRY